MFCQKMAKAPFMKNIIAASPNAKTSIPGLSCLESFFIFDRHFHCQDGSYNGSSLAVFWAMLKWHFCTHEFGRDFSRFDNKHNANGECDNVYK